MYGFVIYTREKCPWCDKAKELIIEKNFEYKELVLERDYTKSDLQKLLQKDRVTVPQIWVDGNYIGGYEDLKKFFE